MQKTLDSYSAGVQITQVQMQKVDPPAQVIDAFRDVQAARADAERLQNEAQTYANRVVPDARGRAAQILQVAEGYKEQAVAEAKGQSCALPEGLRRVQEGARRDAPAASISRPWSACSAAPRRSSIDGGHGPRLRASCPICRSTN